MFFSKVSGWKDPEIFEKSIDKHKIDAILESAVQSERSRCGVADGRMHSRAILRKNPASHPDTRISMESLWLIRVLMVHGGRQRMDIIVFGSRGVL